MTLWQGILLGLVQGVTEFLPVSSDGHLVLAGALAGVSTPGVFVEVALHVATLGAVLVVYGGRFARLALGVLRGNRDDIRYVALLVLATLPAVLVGLFLKHAVEQTFDSLWWAGGGFLVTGTVLWTTRRRGGGGGTGGVSAACRRPWPRSPSASGRRWRFCPVCPAQGSR
jgi:undecaprenyl-diphosphatase